MKNNENNKETFLEYVENTFTSCKNLMSRKNHDYASKQNRYSNFEEAAVSAGIKPEQSILNLIGVKLARLRQLGTEGKDPNYEAFDDSIQDAINYLLILGGYKKNLQ